jgi:DNA-binding transcriptional MerR regulator/methylmalonyl-CoA mutase cobalamin-binding subunit
METPISHPIRYVALQTGLKPYLIRTWEVRYRAVCPKRTDSNRRLYSDDDVKRLKLLKMAVDCGHAISSVVPLSNQDLQALVEQARSDRQRPDAIGSAASAAHQDRAQDAVEHTLESALTHIMQLDPQALESVLSEAAVAMPRQAFLQSVIVPLFVRIGELWRSGNLKIVSEHMASAIVRSMLWDMLRALEIAETAPRLVVATPVGHWHEFGALISALAASESGWRALYFGPNLPSEEIVYAVKKCDAAALTLSIGHCLNDKRLPLELLKIRRAVGSRMPIFIGGDGVVCVRQTVAEINAVVVDDLTVFRDQLERFMREASDKQH